MSLYSVFNEDYILNDPDSKPGKFLAEHKGHENVQVRSRPDGMGELWFSFRCDTCNIHEAEWE